MTVYLFWLTKIIIVNTTKLFPRGGVTGSGYFNTTPPPWLQPCKYKYYLTIWPIALEGEMFNCFSIIQLVRQKRL